jgi:hypothetical protein
MVPPVPDGPPRAAGAQRAPDFVSALPPDVVVQIVSAVPTSVAAVPRVCRAWRDLFGRNAPSEAAFRALVRSRFGVTKRPRWAPRGRASWGRIFLAFSLESCHLCRERNIRHGAFASLAAFAELLPSAPLTLFPVCATCVATAPAYAGMPVVVDVECLCDVFPHVTPADVEVAKENARIDVGSLYNASILRRRSKAAGKAARLPGIEHVHVMYASDLLERWPLPLPGAR